MIGLRNHIGRVILSRNHVAGNSLFTLKVQETLFTNRNVKNVLSTCTMGMEVQMEHMDVSVRNCMQKGKLFPHYSLKRINYIFNFNFETVKLKLISAVAHQEPSV